MRPFAFIALPLFHLPLALAAIGGRCDGFGTQCICLDVNDCARRGGASDPGSPGAWTCPHDPDNVQGCWISGCDTNQSFCTWREGCWGTVSGKPSCPGGNDFVCCNY